MSIEIPINVNMEVEESQMAFDMEVDEEINVSVIQGTDVSDTTAVEADVLSGKKFHKANGDLATGSLVIQPWNWIGKNATLVKTDLYSVALADTLYNSWTPSTTAKEIVAANSSIGTLSIDVANYDYTILYTLYTDLVYNSGVANNAKLINQIMLNFKQTMRRPSNYNALMAKDLRQVTDFSVLSGGIGFLTYYNSSGNPTFQQSSSYGFYIGTMPALSFSSTSSDTPTMTYGRPPINARCNNTYFSTTSASGIDKTNSKIYIRTDIYRADKDALMQAIFRSMVNEFVV